MKMGEMFGICVSMGVSPSYILDEMEMYELKYIISQNETQYKEEWERARVLAHSIYQSQASKEIEVNQVLKFPWDEEETVDQTPKKTTEQMREYAKALENKMNGINA